MCENTKEKYRLEFIRMYLENPKRKEFTHMSNVGDVFDLYTVANDIEYDFITILRFSNWTVDKIKENHGIGLLFPTKEMLALVFVMETVYNVKSGWRRGMDGSLEGGWISQ